MIRVVLKTVILTIYLIFFAVNLHTLAATITVTNTNDAGAGSLMQAIADASANDIIDFSVTGTITLSSGLLISKNLTINGPGASQLTISGNNSVRVIYINGPYTVDINNLSIINGKSSNYGGGIENEGTLTIDNCVFTGNQVTGSGSGGAVDSYNGSTTITNSVFTGNTAADRGGAISPFNGTTIIENCTLDNNNAAMGGAIGQYQSTGTLTVTSCTISNNHASDIGGGIYWYDGNVNIKNSTLSGNNAANQGGAYSDGTSANIINMNSCTIVNNTVTSGSGGGINLRAATVNMKNTILAGNTASTGENLNTSGSGSLNSQGYNLCNAALASFTGTGDIENGTLNIGPLANNGGSAKTHALLTGSDAINAIPEGGNSYNGVYATDQRGYSRPIGTNADIGAFELNGTPASQATDVSFSNLTTTSATISWTRPETNGGQQCVVFIKEGSTGTAAPVDGNTYTANANYASGTQIGSTGWYCVYNGTDATVNVTGLTSGTTFRVHVCEYNQDAGTEYYLIDSATGNPNNVTTNGASIIFVNGANAGLSFEQTNAAPSQANWPCGQFSLTADIPGATLNSVVVTLGGTYDPGDLASTPFQLYASNTNDFSSSSALGSSVADPGSGSDVTFSGLGDAVPASVRYYWVTADISASATGDDTMNGAIDAAGDLSIASGTLSGASSYGQLNAGSDVSLPVELVSFTAKAENGVVVLEWATASETDNLGFIIERRLNSKEWQQIASYQTHVELAGKGTTSNSSQYSFTDDVTIESEYTYRLSEVSVIGQTTVLATTEVETAVTPTATQLFAAYPNPFNPSTNLKYQLAQDSHVVLAVYDVLGRQVRLLADQQQAAGEYSLQWDGTTDAGLAAPSGTYLVRMQAGAVTQVQKVLFVK